MTQRDIWEHLLAGGRVRPSTWPEGSYCEFQNGYIVNQYGQKMEHWGFSDPSKVVVL